MNRFLIILFVFVQASCTQDKGWTELVLTGEYYATSALGYDQWDEESEQRYRPYHLFDGDYTTTWAEGEKGDGIGESVFVVIPENCRTINILNGYGKSGSTYGKNNRVKKIRLSYFFGINPEGYVTEISETYLAQKFPEEFEIDLKDTFGLQTVKFPFSTQELNAFRQKVEVQYHKDYDIPIYRVHPIIQLEITEVYKGSEWDDTCISELFFSNTFIKDNRNVKYNEIKNVYIDEASDGRVLIDIPGKTAVAILEDESSVFQIAEASSDNQWVTLIQMDARAGAGRVETIYLLINTHVGKIMNKAINQTEGEEISGPFFLSENEGQTILEHSSGKIVLR